MTTILLALISLISSAATIYLFLEELRNRRQFGWKHADALVKKLLQEMRRKSYTPDLVLGVGRGGAILAGMLAGNLGHLPLAVIDTVLDRSEGVSTAKVRFPESCPPVKDKSVLVVVGELYSGEDLKQAVEFVRRRRPREIKTATLLTHPAASIRPDFVGLESKQPLTAPWRISDQYKTQRL